MSKIVCPRCSKEIENDTNKCPHCNYQLAEKCSNCGAEIALNELILEEESLLEGLGVYKCKRCGEKLIAWGNYDFAKMSLGEPAVLNVPLEEVKKRISK